MSFKSRDDLCRDRRSLIKFRDGGGPLLAFHPHYISICLCPALLRRWLYYIMCCWILHNVSAALAGICFKIQWSIPLIYFYVPMKIWYYYLAIITDKLWPFYRACNKPKKSDFLSFCLQDVFSGRKARVCLSSLRSKVTSLKFIHTSIF